MMRMSSRACRAVDRGQFLLLYCYSVCGDLSHLILSPAVPRYVLSNVEVCLFFRVVLSLMQ